MSTLQWSEDAEENWGMKTYEVEKQANQILENRVILNKLLLLIFLLPTFFKTLVKCDSANGMY